jgi:hypothetical protein
MACDRAPQRVAQAGRIAEAGTPRVFDVPVADKLASVPVNPGSYLVAVDTPGRTYLDYVHVPGTGLWRPEPGWPQLADWEGQSTFRSLRFVSFAPGDVLDVQAIGALLPVTAPAEHSIDVTSAPYRAPVSPADATASLQAALDAAKAMAKPGHPVDVVVPAGTYDYAAVLEVGADVRLRGAGGVLRATSPASSAIHLGGDRSAALFLHVVSLSSSVRTDKPDGAGIWVGRRSDSDPPIHDTLVVGNEVTQPSSAHFIGIGEVGGLWAFNFAHDGYADAFHHTGGSSFCQVVANRATGMSRRGDDFYAFVGYSGNGDTDPVNHCTCIGNWGRDGPARGIAAVGAGYVLVADNDIARTRAAGIYIARESSFNTFGSFEITVLRNRVALSNLDLSHDGLLAYADSPEASSPSRTFGMVPNAIRNLIVKENTFMDIVRSRGGGYGIEVRDSCRGGTISGNTVERATEPGIVVQGAGFVVTANSFSPR